jgi:hypothetical protein
MNETIKRLAETLLYALDLEAAHNPAFNELYNSSAQWPETMTSFDYLHVGLQYLISEGIPPKEELSDA